MKTLNLHNAIEIALKVEEKGAEVYNQLSEKYSSNPEISEAFKLLAKDEQIHFNQFLAIKKELPETLDVESEIDKEFLDTIDPSRFIAKFNLAEADLLQILRVAYDFEKETYLFYTAVRDVIGGNDQLNKIIEYEKSHMVKIFNYILTESKFRGIADRF